MAAMAFWWAVLVLGVEARWPLRAGHEVPASFDCEMRKLAYAYGRKLLPRLGAFESLYYALDLNNESCHVTLEANSPSFVPTAAAWDDATTIFVDVDGDDQNVGSESKPLRSLQVACDRAVQLGGKTPTVVLRKGTHFLDETLMLGPQHSNLTITSYPNEHAIISGGKKLQVNWKPYKLSGANIWVTDVAGQVKEIPALHVDGVRATRARYPNMPHGIEVSCGYGCMIDGSQQVWNGPNFHKYGNVSWYTDTTARHYRNTAKEWFNEYMIGVGGLCSVYDPPVSYWCSEHPSGGGAFPFRTPSGVIYKPPNGPYEHGEDARFFVWRPARWANWMFDVASYDKATNNFTFGRGGNQGARGSNQGGDFFIENVMEELDYPGEFFFDTRAQKLYLYHNGTGAPSDSIVVPQVQVLVNLTGTQWKPVKGVQLKNLAFSAAAPTYMMPHGVPSAGDWALDRYSAVFLQGTQKTLIDGCTFERLEGNAVMISGYNRDATVESSDFAFLGGNAIVAWGYTNETSTDPGRPGIILKNAPKAGIDGTDGEHPVRTTVQNCSAREIGLYEKQSSFFVQAKTAESRILSNVFFNGPRAGINMNDGFGGGDEIAYNLVFSTCRESGDHGPFNSWDRQPFLTTVRTGEPSMIMQWRRIHHNFFIDNYSPQEGVDNDDGSAYYKTHDNFLVYGNQAMKNDFGGHDNHHFDNVDAYIGHALGVVETLEGHEDYFYGNYVVLQWETVGSCLPQKQMHDNQYFTPTGKVKEGCEGFGGNVSKLPRDEEILNQAKKKLGMLRMDISLVV